MEREARCIVYSVLQVIYANTISMISSCVNLQCIPGLSLLSTNIACVATVEVDLTMASHQGWVGHSFGAVEAPPSGVCHSLHHWVQHLIQICVIFLGQENHFGDKILFYHRFPSKISRIAVPKRRDAASFCPWEKQEKLAKPKTKPSTSHCHSACCSLRKA